MSFRLICFHEFLGVKNTQFLKMFSIGKDWISWCRSIGSEKWFHGKSIWSWNLFWYCKIQTLTHIWIQLKSHDMEQKVNVFKIFFLILIWFHELLSVINTQFLLIVFLNENWISYCKISGSGNSFLKNAYDQGFF